MSNIWLYFVPPIAGGIIGYFTNDIAIKMLFRPYRPYYIFRRKLPFTPGLIPANQERLAKRVADTIMGSLLTPSELQNLARRLLQTERMEAAILWLLQMSLDQLKLNTDTKSTKILANILRDLLGQSLPRLLKVWAKREYFLEAQINQIFDQILLEFQLTEIQAAQLSDWLLKVVVPPDVLRKTLIDFLTDQNISIIDEGFREKASGTYWVVANLFGLRNTLTRLRTFCLDERDLTNQRLMELITALAVKERITEWLHSLSMQNLPVSTVRELRNTMQNSVRLYLQENGTDLIQALSLSVAWEHIADLIINRLQASSIMNSSLELVSRELALILERYLERDLENIVALAIPILNIDQVIIDRIKGTSAEELEVAVNVIVKNELQAIVNLGGVLGVVVGSFQTILLVLQR
ncbi:MAG: DUF445 family protein [Trichodesmium sp. St16_bin4-tuft]|uniref:UPF0754 membrane protein Tery_3973 n=1 Tax=Trichodesmium erythraeum (strain IMS101) TaxID=203124 RepID=Y3973_TRIEI|nr:RecName: Full=UPF0754 membrane protein Tery_3973 [Trichodesmium erythraeum IMS101]MBS9769714.1 DUF445 domain-containing protein [Trichodesmium erythraeum GBRTRLIN201]MCH2048302.1 DUF445 family protein [Trichodesmium sp. ALOHA_ZT_67]MCL2928915.1 DUF445 family protein [Trichodesmium sp. MAG_R01]MDE5070709.1 DUF445 family protein [Trichodesmium sp. St5_bin8]MDE5077972.1 DUF445 family protein [Trichodesmium sp. St2_bin6]MDE5092472.1 DUF445 family protein [Trichodesmium sp. St18_bin3_1_1]MDE50